jgi:drug/metabolite transporter (DMT)-like permease
VGVGAGVGIVILLEALNNGVYSRADLLLLTGAAPLAVISYLETKEEASKHNLKRLYIVLGLILAGIIFLLLFHLFIKPLDVTWYILLRKLGV